MLLKEAQKGLSRFLRLKNLILLIIREFSLLTLIFIFANPVIIHKEKIAIIDNSYTMEKNLKLAIKKAKKFDKYFFAKGEKEECVPYELLFDDKSFSGLTPVIITYKDKIQNSKYKLIELPKPVNVKIDSVYFEAIDTIALSIKNLSERNVKIFFTSDIFHVKREILFSPYERKVFKFYFWDLSSSFNSGYFKIMGDDITFDNIFYFTIALPRSLKICIIGDTLSAFFVKTALSQIPFLQVKYLKEGLPSSYDVLFILNKPLPEGVKNAIITQKGDKNGVFYLKEIDDDLKFPYYDEVRFFSYKFSLPSGEVLSSFSSGEPAIELLPMNNLLLHFDFNPKENEIAVSAGFIQFLLNLIFYLTGERFSICDYRVGECVKLRVRGYRAYRIETPEGHFFLYPEKIGKNYYLTFYPEKSGNYSVENLYKFSVNLKFGKEVVRKNLSSEISTRSLRPYFLIFLLLLLIAEFIIRNVTYKV